PRCRACPELPNLHGARPRAGLLRRGQPAAGEAGSLQTPPEMRVLLHDAPDQRRALVFDHRADGSLVDAEIVDVHPAESRDGTAMTHRYVETEARVEGVEEAVLGINVLPETPMHF